MRSETLILTVFGISVVYVGLVLFVAYIARRLESKLIVMGLLTSVAAVAYGSLVGEVGMQVASQGMSAQMGISTQIPGGAPADMLMRLGVILVLAGVGVACTTKYCPPSPENRSPQP